MRNLDMKICSNRNLNKTEVYHQKSRTPPAQLEAHSGPQKPSMKRPDKSTEDTMTILPAGKQKVPVANTMMKNKLLHF